MIRKYNLPEEITLPNGTRLKPVIGGHLDGKPFLTVAGCGVDCTRPNWGTEAMNNYPDSNIGTLTLELREAKARKLRYRKVSVLSRQLRGKLDLHGRPYTGSQWLFVEVT